MELLSMATIGGLGAGCFARQGLRFPGLAFSPLPNSGDEIVALLKAVEVRVPFPNLEKSLPQKLGPQYVPILVKRFTSSGA